MDESAIKKAYQKILFIALAMIYGCVMFAGMIAYLSQRSPSSASIPENIRYMAWVMGAVSLGASFIFKQKFLLPEANTSADPQEKAQRKVSKLTTSTIIAFALTESAVLMGLILVFLSKNVGDIYAPLFFGVLGFGAHFPKFQEWKNYIEKN